MADVGIIEGEKLLIQIGDGATTEVFTHPCLINTTRGITFVTTGAGIVDKASVLAYIQWLNTAAPKNAKVRQDTTGANGGWTGSGKLLLKDFAITGERGDYQECTLTLVPAGVFTWAVNP